MSWRFPDKRVTNTGVMGVEDANDAMLPVVEEVSGRLNEQNWATAAFTNASAEARFSKDMAYRHFRMYAIIADPTDPVADSDFYHIPLDSTWHVPVNGANVPMSHTFDSVGGSLYICARSYARTQGGTTSGMPMLTALRVNGALIPESICGNMDIGDYALLEATGMQYGFNAMNEITIPISPGRTTVELVVRTRYDSGGGVGSFICGLASRSLIIWEIAR